MTSTIKAYFTDAKVPKTGLTPIITMYHEDGTKYIDGEAMTEVGLGWYSYIASGYVRGDIGTIDGTATLTDAVERYQYVDEVHLK